MRKCINAVWMLTAIFTIYVGCICIQRIMNQPSFSKEQIQSFLTQYNQTWCQAVTIRSPNLITPFLSEPSSQEYKFLVHYIETLNNQSWFNDLERLQSLQIIQVESLDRTHILVTTKETYHHTTHILQSKFQWKAGTTKEYNNSVSWKYTIKLVHPNTFEIESLNRS